jgi:S1-C subfamily serine protease
VATAKQVLDGIVKEGRVSRGWIGVEPYDLSPELSETFGASARSGVIIAGVLQGGPAAKAGVVPGDVIMAIDGVSVEDVSQLLALVAALKPGVAAPFSVQRKKETLQLSITPGLRPRPQDVRR